MDPRFRFCPYCARSLVWRSLEGRSRLACESCQEVFYGNAKPCAGAVITDGAKVLLSRRQCAPYAGYWDIPGGYLEEDEHPVAAVRREVLEETGLTIEVGPLIGLYLDRYGPDSPVYTLNIFYEARATGGSPRPACDVAALEWFDRSTWPVLQLAFGHTATVLQDWWAMREIHRPRPGP